MPPPGLALYHGWLLLVPLHVLLQTQGVTATAAFVRRGFHVPSYTTSFFIHCQAWGADGSPRSFAQAEVKHLMFLSFYV